MRRITILIMLVLIIFVAQGCGENKGFTSKSAVESPSGSTQDYTNKPSAAVPIYTSTSLPTPLNIPRITCNIDKDGDGMNDLDDIVEGARKDAQNMPRYKSVYYKGGYPPDSEGVCTDVVWRALKNAGYNLKDMMDKDIKANTRQYPAVEGKPDPNIDFRRVKNLLVFFEKYATRLTTEVVPYNVDNLKEWQGGDIVIFSTPEHIVVVSDKRGPDGVPYIIHNAGPYTMEVDNLMAWLPGVSGHFRFPKSTSAGWKNQ